MKIKLLAFFLGLSVSLLAHTAEPKILSNRIGGKEISFKPNSAIELSSNYYEIIFQKYFSKRNEIYD